MNYCLGWNPGNLPLYEIRSLLQDDTKGCNVKKDIYVQDGQIIDKKNITSKVNKVIDCRNKIVMPGAIDMHTHIGGGKVNIARLMLEEFHTEQNPNFDSIIN